MFWTSRAGLISSTSKQRARLRRAIRAKGGPAEKGPPPKGESAKSNSISGHWLRNVTECQPVFGSEIVTVFCLSLAVGVGCSISRQRRRRAAKREHPRLEATRTQGGLSFSAEGDDSRASKRCKEQTPLEQWPAGSACYLCVSISFRFDAATVVPNCCCIRCGSERSRQQPPFVAGAGIERRGCPLVCALCVCLIANK